MRTTAALNRIIDKIAENQPARLEAKVRRRAASSDPDADASFQTQVEYSPTFTRRVADEPSVSPPSAADRKRPLPDEADVAPPTRERLDDETRRTQRRRQIDPTTCERDYSADEIEFMRALDDYKRASGRMFPTCSEILEVFKSLGYVKIAIAPPSAPPTRRDVERKRAATPAFLSDDEDDAAFELADAPVLEIA